MTAPTGTALLPHHTSMSHERVSPWLIAPALPDAGFGVYVHVPFCAHVCPYCDFNTYAGLSDLIPAYVEAVTREIAQQGPDFAGRQAVSLFLGGGTPSQLSPAQVGQIIQAVSEAFDLAAGAEVTIETNPNDLSKAYCAGLLAAGVNRLSIGAQTLDRRGLRTLGRQHEAADTVRSLAAAQQAGFTNISLDFIYGWPGQTLDAWRRDLTQILEGSGDVAPPQHLSLYSLIVEPGTPMADAVTRGILTPPDDDTTADFAELAEEILAQAGWLHYEIANWAAAPDLISRHNAVYWRNGDYAGIGAGAHGHLAGQRTMNQPSPQRYITLLNAGTRPRSNVETIDEPTAIGETMMLGLRLLSAGVNRAAFEHRHGASLVALFAPQLARLQELGLIEQNEVAVRLTNRGAMLANAVAAELMPE
ncbi:MAG: radical SAM family heme chaperone HemW [Thermomicrobiales bacterium]